MKVHGETDSTDPAAAHRLPRALRGSQDSQRELHDLGHQQPLGHGEQGEGEVYCAALDAAAV